MAAKEEKVPWAGGGDIQIVKWKVRKGSMVSKGSVLALYVIAGSSDTAQTVKLKSKSSGLVVEISAEEKAVVHPGDLLLVIHPQTDVTCTHPTIMKDMCADCGADLRREMGMAGERNKSVTASVAMVHNIPELIVSQEQALELGKEDENRLLHGRKLVLLVDLDQTLVHTTNDNIPPNLKDVKHFQLWHGKNYMWYHTRFRPFTQQFLDAVSKMYELHICTFGVRMYAHIIARLMDPDEKYFSHRILSRDECFDPLSKTANLKALFPCGDKMVGIIDDREDVWNHAPNLVHVKPYRFFQGTADINAPPGLTKCEHDNEPISHKLVDQSKLKNDKVSEVGEKHGSVSISLDAPITHEDSDSKKLSEVGGGNSHQEEQGKQMSTSSSAGGEMAVTDDKDVVFTCSGDVKDSKDCNLEHNSSPGVLVSPEKGLESTNILKIETETGGDVKMSSLDQSPNPENVTGLEKILENTSVWKAEACSSDIRNSSPKESPNSEKGVENSTISGDMSDVKDAKPEESPNLEKGVKNSTISADMSDVKYAKLEESPNSEKGVENSTISGDMSDVKDAKLEESPNSEKGVENSTISGDISDVKDASLEQSSNPGNLAHTEPTVSHSEKIIQESKDVSSKRNSREASNQPYTQGSGELKTGRSGPPGEQQAQEVVEWADEDDYLLHLEEILTRIHKAYYGMYEQCQHNGSSELPDLKNIIPYVRKKTLKGANIVLSGMFPLNVGLEKSRPYAVAKALGANVQNDIVPRKTKNGNNAEATTHLVASKPGTGKYKTAVKTKGIHVVSGDWLWACNERWEWVDERCYPLVSKDPVSKTPKPQKSGTKKRKNGEHTIVDIDEDVFGDQIDGLGVVMPSKKLKIGCQELNKDSETQPTSSTSVIQISDENFANSFNPLYSFSDEDIEFMDKEVDELMDEDEDSSESDEEREARIRQKVLGKGVESDSDSESLSGDLPRGLKMHRKSLSPQKDNTEDEEKETDACDDDETENELTRYQKNMAAFAGDESESASDRDDDSVGSVDDEIAEAVEKEFLASL